MTQGRLHALLAAVLAPLLLLGGCASFQSSPPPATTAAERSYHDNLTLAGRLSVRYEGRSGEEALHGGFQWQQSEANTSVTLLSPLGQALARIETTPSGATLMQAGRQPVTADDVDTLTAHALGWPLPVAGLRGWLQGFAVTAEGSRFVATPDGKTVATRDGWHIEYPNWQDDGNGRARPRRIDLTRKTEQAGAVVIRIVIDTWQIH